MRVQMCSLHHHTKLYPALSSFTEPQAFHRMGFEASWPPGRVVVVVLEEEPTQQPDKPGRAGWTVGKLEEGRDEGGSSFIVLAIQFHVQARERWNVSATPPTTRARSSARSGDGRSSWRFMVPPKQHLSVLIPRRLTRRALYAAPEGLVLEPPLVRTRRLHGWTCSCSSTPVGSAAFLTPGHSRPKPGQPTK